MLLLRTSPSSFFFNDPPTPDIYTLFLHDALPISRTARTGPMPIASLPDSMAVTIARTTRMATSAARRSEEHTSELQSRLHLVCRLLLEKTRLYYYLTITSHNPSSRRLMHSVNHSP